MKIHTKLIAHWDGSRYVLESLETLDYDGIIDSCCGATAAQTSAQQQQSAFSQQLSQQATQVFGNSSSVFNDLVSTFAPTVAAGPNQQGFSAAENANLQSQAITSSGQAYQNAKQAVGEAQSAQGGGNTGDVSTGSTTGTDLGIATSAAQNTANELGQINEANYQTGRQNYDTAVSGLEQAPNVFNASTSLDNATTGSQEGAANTANQIATQNNSWVQAVTGALGGIAGATITGGMKNLGSGAGFFGGSNNGGSSANTP